MTYGTTRNSYVLRRNIRLPLATRIRLLEQMDLPHGQLGPERIQSNQGTSMEEELMEQIIGTYDHTNQTSIYVYTL